MENIVNLKIYTCNANQTLAILESSVKGKIITHTNVAPVQKEWLAMVKTVNIFNATQIHAIQVLNALMIPKANPINVVPVQKDSPVMESNAHLSMILAILIHALPMCIVSLCGKAKIKPHFHVGSVLMVINFYTIKSLKYCLAF